MGTAHPDDDTLDDEPRPLMDQVGARRVADPPPERGDLTVAPADNTGQELESSSSGHRCDPGPCRWRRPKCDYEEAYFDG